MIALSVLLTIALFLLAELTVVALVILGTAAYWRWRLQQACTSVQTLTSYLQASLNENERLKLQQQLKQPHEFAIYNERKGGTVH
jgi:hypothetical protein